MTLPSVPLPSSTVVINEQSIAIRSLTRKETMQIKAGAEDLEECEILLLMYGTNSSREEVVAFRETTPPQATDDLVTAIADLSGFETTKGKGKTLARAKSTNGRS